jgi:tetratricopeptide (TPR) repeat protein
MRSAEGVHNDLSGSTSAAVQAGTVDGGVHVTVGGSEPWAAVPRQLPPDVVAFVNRTRELSSLDDLLPRPHATPGPPLSGTVSTIAGAPGVGKTALAVHWAHRVRPAFPDGDLYVDLRGYDLRARLTADQALSSFLHALNVPPARIPVEPEARAALFRSLLATRRVLVVLDNAATAEQVRLLIPGTGHCFVLVTSRSRLSGLVARDGASRVTLAHLTPIGAHRLLSETVGRARLEGEPEAARRLAELCDRLPLALRIVAERVVSHPHRSLADFVDELSDERDRLDGLALDEDELSVVRSVFSWSYRALVPKAARAFRLLALHPSAVFTTTAVAALTGTTRGRTARLLDCLSGLHLIEPSGRDRYRMHDLLRTYAVEKAMEEETDELRGAAIDRTLNWYLRTAQAASRLILPQRRELSLPDPPGMTVPGAEGAGGVVTLPETTFESLESALQWCEDERLTLLDAVRQAHTLGKDEIAWKLPVALMGFFERRSYWDDWIATHRTGLQSARRMRDRFGEGWLALGLADAYWDTRRFDEALECFEQALAATREIGDRWGEGFSLRGMSIAHLELGNHEAAIDYSRQAQPIFAEIGERRGEGMCHLSIGQGHQGLGRFDAAIACYQQALSVFQQLGNAWSTALVTYRLGTTLHQAGDTTQATAQYIRAAGTFRRLGDRRHQAFVLSSLGDLHASAGSLPSALMTWGEALALFEQLADPQAEEVRRKIAAAGAPPA